MNSIFLCLYRKLYRKVVKITNDRQVFPENAAASSRPVPLPVGVVRGATARKKRRGGMSRWTPYLALLFLMGGLHGVRHDADSLVPDWHLLRLFREEAGDQPGLSAGRIQHGHVPHGDVTDRQLHHGHRTPGKSRGDVRTGAVMNSRTSQIEKNAIICKEKKLLGY